MARLPPCPFCRSGVPWNDCLCDAARHASTHGMMSARKLYPVIPLYATTGECAPCDLARAEDEAGASERRTLPVPTTTATPPVGKTEGFDRAAYQREYMRRRRAEAKAAHPPMHE